MPDGWYYAQKNDRKGPVPFARLRGLAADGWLARDDLVWRPGMPAWVPAKEIDGVFSTTLSRVMSTALVGLRPSDGSLGESAGYSRPPSIPEKPSKPKPRRRQYGMREINPGNLGLRHLIAACGGFLAALGIAFTAVAQSQFALAFTLSGLFITAVGLYVEIGKLLSQAIENIGKALREAADRRLRAKELALEKQKLDLEAARLAQEQAARATRALSDDSPVNGTSSTVFRPMSDS